jgi:hypothetical protein
LYCRVYGSDVTVVDYKDKFREMYFITIGGVRFQNQMGMYDFHFLGKNNYFGDYQILHDLHSNFKHKTMEGRDTWFYCINKKKMKELADYFPKTKRNLERMSLHTRYKYILLLCKFDDSEKNVKFDRQCIPHDFKQIHYYKTAAPNNDEDSQFDTQSNIYGLS